MTQDQPANLEAGVPPEENRGFFGHPRGLATLFGTEMWERFSFYGMRALLVLYLATPTADGGLGYSAITATGIYAVYNSLVYLLALPGGWIADRLWGARRTVGVAAAIIMIGHFLLAVPVTATFFVGLVFIAVGSGLLKANISTMVGQLYHDPRDPRRDGGFTIFYMGINIGAFAAPYAIGTLGQNVNFHAGFGLAGFGMLLGLGWYLWGGRHLSPESSLVPSPLSAEEKRAILRKIGIGVAVVVVFYLIVVLTGAWTLNWATVPLTVIGLVFPAWTLYRIRADRELSGDERKKMTGYIWFFVAAAVFWMIYDQGGSTLNLFANDRTNTSIAGWHFPSSWFQSVNPLYIIILAPVFASMWQALARRGKEPTTTVKFAMGLLLVGVSFVVFYCALAVLSEGEKASPLWLAAIFLIQTIGELCLSPVGLSVTTKLAPEKYASQMMGVWFLAVTAGDCVTSLATTFGANLNSRPVVLVEAVAALVAGVAFLGARRRIAPLLGNVR
ncbi:peptide MFS transporter [Phaeacidiphilus oryzae]|uniref:peptide MFS transporter n=1 Tax=Phaeacidiphilus oryzae TaxID=348818 RepID=UPI00055E5047|nr:oligopeptide:H+ symporter [Phaeacidiphilus oryzae]